MGFIKDENCHIIDKLGQIRVYTGSSFEPYQWLPCYFRGEKVVKLPHRNGFNVKGNIVRFLWEGQYPDPAGIWHLEDNNLYHSNSFVFDKVDLNSIGSIEVEEFRALYEEDEIYAGANLIDGNETEINGIYSSINPGVTEENRYNFVTSKFIVPEIDNIWQDIVLKYDAQGKDGNIIVKHKTEPARIEEATAFEGEWTSDDTFTCDTASFVSAVDAGNIKIGDEIIVRKGQGAGLLAHITGISGTTTKTITIDEGLDDIASGKFTFSIEVWEKINFNINKNKFSAKASLKDKRLTQAQFKVDARNFTLEEMQVLSLPDNTINKK